MFDPLGKNAEKPYWRRGRNPNTPPLLYGRGLSFVYDMPTQLTYLSAHKKGKQAFIWANVRIVNIIIRLPS